MVEESGFGGGLGNSRSFVVFLILILLLLGDWF
jgi:hypothetical protein